MRPAGIWAMEMTAPPAAASMISENPAGANENLATAVSGSRKKTAWAMAKPEASLTSQRCASILWYPATERGANMHGYLGTAKLGFVVELAGGPADDQHLPSIGRRWWERQGRRSCGGLAGLGSGLRRTARTARTARTV